MSFLSWGQIMTAALLALLFIAQQNTATISGRVLDSSGAAGQVLMGSPAEVFAVAPHTTAARARGGKAEGGSGARAGVDIPDAGHPGGVAICPNTGGYCPGFRSHPCDVRP